MKIDKLQQSHEDYLRRRALEKYDGKVQGFAALNEFRKGADYLATLLGSAVLDEDDLGDMVRVALSKGERPEVASDEAKGKAAIVL